jgi:hypothetical protein
VKRRILGLLVAATLLTPVGIAATPTPAIAFTGHHCTRATCTFFTSTCDARRDFCQRRDANIGRHAGRVNPPILPQ